MVAPRTSRGRSGASRSLVLCLALVAGACAPGDETSPADAQGPDLPGGYLLRLDSERGDPAEFQLELDAEGLGIVTGPAGIVWRPTDTVASGDFRAEATFVQYEAPLGYREAYGVFVGGSDLQGPDQEYIYLLVRPTGDYLVKRRRGETTEVLVDWTPHEAVRRVANEGDEPENTLAVEVLDGRTSFLVNGTEVHHMPSPQARPYGVAGIRANHRLDILVRDWSLGAIPPATSTP